MKRLLTIALVALVALTMPGCGGKSNSRNKSNKNAAVENTSEGREKKIEQYMQKQKEEGGGSQEQAGDTSK